MRRIAVALAAGLLLASVAGSVNAAKPAAPGFLPANAQAHGYSLVDVATAWNYWAFANPEATNPTIAGRCEQSSLNPKIWFLPVSIGGDYGVTCAVPQGAFLVVVVAGSIFTEVTGDGTGADELRALAEEEYLLVTDAEATLDGRMATGLNRYAVTTHPFTLPANNLFGPDPGLTVARVMTLIIEPLSRGTHTMRVYDAFASYDFEAGIDFTFLVR